MPRAAFLTSNITIACTQTAGAGGVGGKTGLYIIPQDRPFADLCAGEARQTEAARCLTARYGQIDRILAIQSDAQAYKQAGYSVTANVIEAIGRRIREADAETQAAAALLRWHPGKAALSTDWCGSSRQTVNSL